MAYKIGKRNAQKKHKNDLVAGLDAEPAEIDEADLEKELMDLLGASSSGKSDKNIRTMQNCDDSPSGSEDVNDDEDLMAELKTTLSGTHSEAFPPGRSAATAAPRRISPLPQPGATMEEINERLSAYRTAVEGLRTLEPVDDSRIRRYERVLKQLASDAGTCSKGEFVDAQSLPPFPPPLPAAALPPSRTLTIAPSATGLAVSSEPLNRRDVAIAALKERCNEYKSAAIAARDAGHVDRARELLMAYKVISDTIPLIEAGKEPFDPDTDMPPPPSAFTMGDANAEAEGRPAPSRPSTGPPPQAPAGKQALPDEMRSPVVTAENLELRMQFFKAQHDAAKASGEDGTARRVNRIMGYYAEAKKAFATGVSGYNYASLPSPSGCPPLSSTAATKPKAIPASSSQGAGMSTNQQIIGLLQKRQSELKAAALQAKNMGNVEVAKDCLRGAHVVQQMIQSAMAGIPVDVASLPRLPNLKNLNDPSGSVAAATGSQASAAVFSATTRILSGERCDPPVQVMLELAKASDNRSHADVLIRIFRDQASQAMELCDALRLVNIRELMNNLSQLAKLNQDAASFLQAHVQRGRPVTDSLYSFEWANLPVLNMNPRLAETDLVVSELRGLSLPLPEGYSSPQQLDTFVELLLRYPSNDDSQRVTTEWVKHTADPVYSCQLIKFRVDVKHQRYSRYVASKDLKVNVYYSRGFLRGKALLGTASFPLQQLTNSATVHLTAQLMNGSRAAGGSLELCLRQRESLSGPKGTIKRTPWLTIDPTGARSAQPQPSVPVQPHRDLAADGSTGHLRRVSPGLQGERRGSPVVEQKPHVGVLASAPQRPS